MPYETRRRASHCKTASPVGQASKTSKRQQRSTSAVDVLPPVPPFDDSKAQSSLATKSCAMLDLTEVDDETERVERHHQQILNRQRCGFDSPAKVADADSRRRSLVTGGGGRSNAEIANHYSQCIKLLTENKICIKNAFNLHLIDYLADVLREKESDEGQTNFQVAGTSLDASAKIYAYRVDIVHQATYQMIGGLGKGDKEKKAMETGKTGAEMDDSIDADYDSLPSRQKKRRRILKGRTVEHNEKSINLGRLECEYEFDPVFRKICLFLEDKESGGLLSNCVFGGSDRERLTLHSYDVEEDAWKPKKRRSSAAVVDVLENCSDIVSSFRLDQLPSSVCPALDEFNFDEIMDMDETLTNMDGDVISGEAEKTMNAADHAEDELIDDAPVVEPISSAARAAAQGIQWPQLDNDIDIDTDIFSSEEDGENVTPGQSMVNNETARLIDNNQSMSSGVTYEMISKAMSDRSEYSFFSPTSLQTWRGPEHWRLKTRKAVKPSNDAEMDDENPKKKRRKKDKTALDFDRDEFKFDPGLRRAVLSLLQRFGDPDASLDDIPKPSKVDVTMTKRTMEKYADGDNLIIDNAELALGYKSDKLNRLYVKETVQLSRDGSRSSPLSLDMNQSYNLENPNDAVNFCGVAMDDAGAAGEATMAGFEFDPGFAEGDESQDEGDIDYGGIVLAEETLDDADGPNGPGADENTIPGAIIDESIIQDFVPVPLQIRGLNIQYAKQAKKVDVRRLKRLMWKVLTKRGDPLKELNCSANNTTDTSSQETGGDAGDVTLEQQVTQPMRFGDLCHSIFKCCPETMAKNLSVPILFVCFLHMCNEKTLQLDEHPDMSDFTIQQG